MDLEEIEKLVNSDGQRIILVKDGEPTFVLLSFKDYQSLSPEINEKQSSSPGKSLLSENKEEVKNELTLEDLPF